MTNSVTLQIETFIGVASSRPELKKGPHLENAPLPSTCFIKEYRNNKECVALVVFSHKRVIINLFNHCKLTVATDGSEDLVSHCLESNQPCAAAGHHWLKGLPRD